ncbi:MAG: glycerol-3-phosphate dehydrogenase/oxidase [Promethearchaeota archaeon]
MSLDKLKEIRTIDWSSNSRPKIIKDLKEKTFDIVVIGGGITGAGIAREAQIRGLNCALLNKEDFAWGTSSRSTKMAHGGIRYLANGEFGIVRESTTERNWLRVHFPNLVRPVKFLFPAYKDGKESPFMLKVAVFLYDFLSNFRSKYKNYRKHKYITAEEAAEEEPNLIHDGMRGAVTYYDTNIDDARLTLETIKEAVILGAVALNYAKVEDYLFDEQGKVCGVVAEDQDTGEKFKVRGTQVVNATGIWTDDLLREHPDRVIRPTKGVHFQFEWDEFKIKHAIAMRHTKDKRAYFVIPREEIVVVGTTDTDFQGDYDEVYADEDDWNYLIESTRHYFPKVKMELDNVISSYAGARPLVMEQGKSESQVSRKHVILDSPNGLTTIAGGKLTIFRKMGEDVILHLKEKKGLFPEISKKKNLSKVAFLIGADWEKWEFKAGKFKLPEDMKKHLYRQYGWGGIEVLRGARDDPNLAERLVENRPFIYAEIPYIVKHELPLHLTDVLVRRMEVQLRVHPKHHEGIARRSADLMGDILGWDEKRKQQEVAAHLEYVKKNSFWIK